MAYDESYGYYRDTGLAPRFSASWWAARFYAGLLRRQLPPGSRVLDLGCGLGNLLRELEQAFDSWGVDVSWFAVHQARANARRSRLWVGDLASLEALPAASFDAVVAKHVLEHIPDPERAVRAIAGALRPGGVFLMAVPNTRSLLRPLKGDRWIGVKDPTHCSVLPPAYWTGAATRAGLVVRRTFSDGFWDVPYVPLLPARLQLPLFGCLAILQVVAGRPFIPVPLGESFFLIAHRPGR